jgi:hypothetical protein
LEVGASHGFAHTPLCSVAFDSISYLPPRYEAHLGLARISLVLEYQNATS